MTTLTSNQGTGNPKYAAHEEVENPNQSKVASLLQCISVMPAYRNWSPDELRMRDYELGRKGTGAT